MTIVTLVAGKNMIRRFATGQHTRSSSVTSHAGRWRPLEHTVHMTGFTTHLTMFTGQLEAGGDVIKLAHHRAGSGFCIGCGHRLWRLSRGRQRQHREQHQHSCKQEPALPNMFLSTHEFPYCIRTCRKEMVV